VEATLVDQTFQKNLKLLQKKNPPLFQKISHLKPRAWKREAGRLVHIESGRSFHDPDDPLFEAESLFENRGEDSFPFLALFGIGLGHFYSASKEWLKEKEERHLFVYEDDLEVIYHFLHTDVAGEMLQDPQVFVDQISFVTIEQEKIFLHLLASSEDLQKVPHLDLVVYPEKLRSSPDKCYKFQSTLKMGWETLLLRLELFHAYNFTNNVENLLRMNECYSLRKLKDSMAGIPVIICGAGPSLLESIDQLKAVQDRALIVAGSTAINILNQHSIQPHLCIAADPTLNHFGKVAYQTSFEGFYCVTSRVYPDATALIPGTKLHIPLQLSREECWINELLGLTGINIEEGRAVETGNSVTTFSTYLAKFLGCSEALIVGADFSYDEEMKRYPVKQLMHPLIEEMKGARAPPHLKIEMAQRTDVESPFTVTSAFLNEMEVIQSFLKRNPDFRLYHAREKTARLAQLKQMDLIDFVEKFEPREEKLDLYLRSRVQEEECNKITKEETLRAVQEMRDSLERVIDRVNQLESLIGEESLLSETEYGRISEKLEREPSFLHLFSDTVYFLKKRIRFRTLLHGKEREVKEERKEILYWVKKLAKAHLRVIEDCAIKEKNLQPLFVTAPNGQESYPSHAVYHRTEETQQGTTHSYFYEGGQLRTRFSEVEGALDGDLHQFYPDGSPLRTLSFSEGKHVGQESWWDAEGNQNFFAHLVEGKLEGAAWYNRFDGKKGCRGLFHQGQKEEWEEFYDA